MAGSSPERQKTLCSHGVFKRYVLQTFKNNGLFGNGFTRQQIIDSSKLKDFADDNFKFDENGRK